VRFTANLLPRMLAGMLALGGLFWGLLLSPWLFRPEASLLAWLVFGPGYLVTLGYVIRATCTPPLAARRLIWVCSLLIQGGWLLSIAWAEIGQLALGRSVHEPSLASAWWLFATVVSFVGFFAEKQIFAEPVPVERTRDRS
jgi:hypothetical protein